MGKKLKKNLMFLVILASVTMIFTFASQVNAETVEETTIANDGKATIADRTIIIGASKFTPDTAITALKAATAGANDLRIYLAQDKNPENYVKPKIYYYVGYDIWFEIDENGEATPIDSIDVLDIYYVDNVAKKGINIPQIGTRVAELEATVSGQEARIAELEITKTQNEQKIAELETTKTQNQQTIAGLEETIQELNSEITEKDAEIENLNNRLEAIEGKRVASEEALQSAISNAANTEEERTIIITSDIETELTNIPENVVIKVEEGTTLTINSSITSSAKFINNGAIVVNDEFNIDSSNITNEEDATITINITSDSIENLNKAIEHDSVTNAKLNTDITGDVTVGENKEIVLDLNNKTINSNNQLTNNGKLTVSNGTINKYIENNEELILNNVNCTATGRIMDCTDGSKATIIGGNFESDGNNTGIYVMKDATLSMKDAEISAGLMAVATNATKPAGEIIFDGCTLTSRNEPAFYLPGTTATGNDVPKLIIKNSTLTGVSGIEVVSGNIEISDSEIIATGTSSNWDYVRNHDTTRNGTTDGGAALYIRSASSYNDGGTINIKLTNTTLSNTNNDLQVIRVYEHANAGVSSITIDSDTEYTIAKELRDPSAVTVNFTYPNE